MDTIIFSDATLLNRIKEGNRLAFNVLFNTYWGKLYAIAKASIKNSEDAEASVQELLINFRNKKETLEVKTTLESYLFGALKLSRSNIYPIREKNIYNDKHK
jgi:DNA-directed RNA polymerase specialized sigma24 family protein